MLSKGEKVLIQGLKAKPELNGLCGEVEESLANGRVKVKLVATAAATSLEAQYLSLKLENLSLLPPDDDPSEDGSTSTRRRVVVPPPAPEAEAAPSRKASSANGSFAMPIINPAQNVWSDIGFFFYPFGNTSAKRLTAYLAPDQGIASILLLGCGDFRHVLFTCWSHEKAGGIASRQRHEVVACDIKPSILARNLILWKLIYESADLNQAWIIFYSKFVDETCAELLKSTALDLLNLTESWVAWNASDFGSLCPFVDDRSFQQVRQLWQFYADNTNLSANSIKRHAFQSDAIRKKNVALSSVLQCDPFYPVVLSNVQQHNDYTKDYISGHVDIFKSIYAFPKSSNKTTLFTNPMMLEGQKERIDLHYNLDPPSGFHPCLAYGPLQDTDKVLPNLSTATPAAQFKADMLTKNAFVEFAEWCKATKARMDRHLIIIHIFVGNAFDLVHGLIARRLAALQDHGEVRSTKNFAGNCYLGGNGLLAIPEDVPVQYDVIDTSNLSHFCGLLNILLTCKMLLKVNLQSIIFTELSSAQSKVVKFSKMLEGWLGTDVKTFSILTGLMPMDYPSTTVCQLNTALSNKMAFKTRQGENLHLRWKLFDCKEDEVNTMRLNLSPTVFADLFFNIYKRLFEVVLHPTPSMMAVEESDTDYQKLKTLIGHDYSNPTSQTFALYVRTALDRMASPPTSGLLRALFDLICTTGYIMQGNVLQDLIGWFAQYQVFTKDDMQIVVDQNFQSLGIRWDSPQVRALTQSCARHDEAFLVLVTLLVPKQVFIDAAMEVPAPIFNMGAFGRFDNVFHTFNMIYLRERPPTNYAWSIDSLLTSHANKCSTMEECSWIACSTVMPLCSFMFAEANRVFVELRLSVHSIKKKPGLMYKLGPQLRIHAAPFSDRTMVSCKLIPYGSNPLDNFLSHSYHATPTVDVKIGGRKIGNCHPLQLTKDPRHTYLTTKIQFHDVEGMQNFKPEIKQLPKPNEMELQLTPSLKCKLVFPLPMDAARSGVQIYRSKGYINFTALPLSSKTIPDRFAHLYIDHTHLRSTSSSSEHYSLYGVSYVLLDTLPEIKIDVKNELTTWFLLMVASGMTEAEREAQRSDSKDKTAIGSWKESMHALLHFLTGQSGDAIRAFSLHSPETGIEVFIYVNALRVEYSVDRSIVLDVSICAPEKEVADDLVLSWYLPKDRSQRRDIVVTKEEMKFWKRLIPAAIERARNDWQHNANTCEYINAQIPLRDDGLGEKMICSCCLGKQLEGTLFMKDLKASSAINASSNFARAAIPIIFAMD